MISTTTELRHRVSDFYAYETALLDDGRLREWLDLLEDDVRYVMPMRETRQGSPSANGNPIFYLYNDDKRSLEQRIARLETGLALVESPPSATQRCVTDILVLSQTAEMLEIRSSFSVVQARDEMNETHFVGRRTDHLTIGSHTLRVRRRDILLVHYVLPRTISLFF
jgi:3-phenylpropionate/trans-cinnamate dioxygenase subunit beta